MRDQDLVDERNSRSQGSLVEMRFAKHVSFGERKPRASPQNSQMKRNPAMSDKTRRNQNERMIVSMYYIQEQLTVQLRGIESEGARE